MAMDKMTEQHNDHDDQQQPPQDVDQHQQQEQDPQPGGSGNQGNQQQDQLVVDDGDDTGDDELAEIDNALVGNPNGGSDRAAGHPSPAEGEDLPPDDPAAVVTAAAAAIEGGGGGEDDHGGIDNVSVEVSNLAVNFYEGLGTILEKRNHHLYGSPMGPPAPPRPQSPEQPMLARSLRELARVPALVRGADLLREWHEKAVMSDSGIACIYAAALWIVFCTLCAASWVASTARAMNSKIMKIRPIGFVFECLDDILTWLVRRFDRLLAALIRFVLRHSPSAVLTPLDQSRPKLAAWARSRWARARRVAVLGLFVRITEIWLKIVVECCKVVARDAIGMELARS